MPIGSHCARCLRPAPAEEDTAYLEWEALTVATDDEPGELLVCPACIAPEEQQAMDDADIEISEFADVVSDLDEQYDDETGTFQEE